MKTIKNTYLPAEWAEQEFVQLTWPHADTDWAEMLDEVTECFTNIARAILKYESLLIVCVDASEIEPFFTDDELLKITFAEMPTNDTWARDHGGITVIENGKQVICDFTFNGWGMKFAANHDNLITQKLFKAGIFGAADYRNCLDFVLEGGSVESDGKGTILTTTECLLSDNRNNLSKKEIEAKLTSQLGAQKILWLNSGYLAGDDTDSHVDTLARLCPNNTILYVKCYDESDEHFTALAEMENELKMFRTLDEDKPYHLIALPMADPVIFEGERIPATYANFLIINGAVLLPVYNSPKDIIAVEKLKEAFPDREVISVDCNALIKQHGSLHCVTMQYPKFM